MRGKSLGNGKNVAPIIAENKSHSIMVRRSPKLCSITSLMI